MGLITNKNVSFIRMPDQISSNYAPVLPASLSKDSFGTEGLLGRLENHRMVGHGFLNTFNMLSSPSLSTATAGGLYFG